MAATNESFVDDDNENHTINHRKNHSQDKFDAGTIELQMDSTKVKVDDEGSTVLCSRNVIAVGLERFWDNTYVCFSNNGRLIKISSLFLLAVLFILYVGAVIRQFQQNDQNITDWCQGYGLALILLLTLTWILVYYTLIVPCLFPIIGESLCFKMLIAAWRKLRMVVSVALVFVLVAFLVWDTSSDRRRLLSFCGLLIFIAFGFIFSKYPTHVRWQTIFAGLVIQFTMGMLAIRWSTGRQVFKCIGSLAETFLEYSYVGASMVFGDWLVRHESVFAFKALSATFFVSLIVQVLFYLGWMQVFCLKLGWILQMTMGTTIMESVNAVSSVFLGMTEAPLLYKPYIKDLTPSEIHAVMVGGFSTIAGTVFAAYTSFGVDPANIITAALMSAPAALCYAKLLHPETTQSKTDVKSVQMYTSEDKSVMDAAVQGALIGINIVQGIIATIIACVSIVAFFNDVVAWLGLLAGISDFSLEVILSYILYPAVWLMGVDPTHCLVVARLIAMKISVNEFVAYRRLGELKKSGVLSVRSETIATFALCSFANPGSLGILISTLTTLCPSQRLNIVTLSLRAILCSIVVTFLTACIAGSLMPEEGFAD